MGGICVFGDSVARGVVFDSALGRYSFLKNGCFDLLRAKTGLNVSNFSKFGCTVKKGGAIVEKHTANISGSDCTLLEYGGNDCDYNWKEISANPDGEHLPNTPPAEFESRYRALIASVREKGGRPVLLNLPPLEPERFFRWASRGNSAENILRWLGSVSRIFDWHESYSKLVEKIAAEEKAPLIDVRSAFLRRDGWEDCLCADGMHPNVDGHKLICEAVLQYV